MKKNRAKTQHLFCSLLSVLLVIGLSLSASGESMNDMMGQFEKEFEGTKPAPNSSVNADYKLEQTALGTLYTTRAINKLFEQNKELLEKYNEMLLKYNEMVLQNKEIIRLLSIIAQKEEAGEKPQTGMAPLE